jgi:hypothetical protein
MVNSPLSKEFEELRKYDIQIAGLLGLRDIKYISEYGDYYGIRDDRDKLVRVPRYEDSIAAAWQIVDHIQNETELYFNISSAGGGGLQYRCDITANEYGDSHIYAIENTPARAIVSSFLKWQGSKEK